MQREISAPVHGLHVAEVIDERVVAELVDEAKQRIAAETQLAEICLRDIESLAEAGLVRTQRSWRSLRLVLVARLGRLIGWIRGLSVCMCGDRDHDDHDE